MILLRLFIQPGYSSRSSFNWMFSAAFCFDVIGLAIGAYRVWFLVARSEARLLAYDHRRS